VEAQNKPYFIVREIREAEAKPEEKQ
jgi:hypothetical protein